MLAGEVEVGKHLTTPAEVRKIGKESPRRGGGCRRGFGRQRINRRLRAAVSRAGCCENGRPLLSVELGRWCRWESLGWKIQVRDVLASTRKGCKRRVHGLLNRAVWRSGWCSMGSGRSLVRKPRAANDQLPKLVQCYAAVRVHLEDPLEDEMEFVRDGQDGLEEVPVTHEGLESAVIKARALPWVAAAGEVHQNHAQRPDVVWC